MDRTKFFNTAIVNGIKELDFLYNTLSSFTLDHVPGRYRVTASGVGRPDLISYINYDTPKYWWIICVVNLIDNPLEDIEEGDILKIPSLLDIHQFFRRYKLR